MNQKKVFKCKICTHSCAYHFYGVKACEGCKQFFRRVVIKQQKYFCSKEQKCRITEGDNCRGCRLTKCLLMGMDPFMVQLKIKPEERAKKLQFIEELKQMQNALWLRREHEMRVRSLKFGDPMVQIWQMINSLMPMERMHKQIWESTKLFPTAYTERHDSVEGLLQDENGLMGIVEYFKSDDCWDKAHFLEELETKSFLHSDYVKLITKDWFLCIETAKGMPFFKKLDISDQISLLKGTINEVCTLSGSFYSNARGTDTITKANGFAPICQLEGKNFPKNQHIRSIYLRANCEGIERIKQTGICNEEFVLILAILYANSNVDNLSTKGRELLYAESVRYSKALHQLLQAKYGILPGAQKFMEAMSLLEVASKMKTLLAAFIINLEMIYERPNKSETFPKAIEFYPNSLVR